MTTDDTKFTLIHYRPNGNEYQGHGDYEHHDSEIGFEHNLSFEQLRRRIIEHAARRRYENDSACQFAILLNGKPIVSRGADLWTFADAAEPSEYTEKLEAILTEANVLSEKEKLDRAEAKRKEEEERQRLYYERQERERYDNALKTLKEMAPKQKAPWYVEKEILAILKAKYEPETKAEVKP